MPITNEEGLYDALAQVLKKSRKPYTSTELWEIDSVREHAASANRVSDYLGNMWRDGKLLRLPAGKMEGTRARFAYAWKPKPEGPKVVNMADGVAFHPVVNELLNRPNLTIVEEGKTVILQTPFLTITIKQNG